MELGPSIADLLSVKDDIELQNVKRAAVFSSVLMQKHLVGRLEAVVDEEVAITHERLAEETEEAFQDPPKLGVKLNPDLLESCYTPIIQSGGKFDLKPSAFSNSEKLFYGGAHAAVPPQPHRSASPTPRPQPHSMCTPRHRHHHLLHRCSLQVVLLKCWPHVHHRPD